jgi:hypothetical protein
MPIDLKWVRNNPDRVREWQTLRRRRCCHGDAVDRCLQLDEVSRNHLRMAQNHKRSLQTLKKRLRPGGCTSDQRQQLLEEKTRVEDQIKHHEKLWKAALEDTHVALCRLASPVGTVNEVKEPWITTNNNNHAPQSRNESNAKRAWKDYTLWYFENYHWVASSTTTTNSPPGRALELWGDDEDENLSVLLPSWIRLLEEGLPSKSIWGDKELPRYTALVSSTKEDELSLGIVALTAASPVDARQVQSELLDELCGYYSSLLVGNSTLHPRILAPHELNPHEWSRIEVWLYNEGKKHRLGWISHWGDAATRACGMAFAGGGTKSDSKEYVHLVEASVVDESTWAAMETHVAAPPACSTTSKTPDLVWNGTTKPKTKDAVFGTKPPPRKPKPQQDEDTIAPKFPPRKPEDTTTKQWEQRSCPFDFVF